MPNADDTNYETWHLQFRARAHCEVAAVRVSVMLVPSPVSPTFRRFLVDESAGPVTTEGQIGRQERGSGQKGEP